MVSLQFRNPIALLFFGALLSACAGTSSLSPAGATPQHAQGLLSGYARHLSSIHFMFQTVDDPNSNVNEVTGIDPASEIVGTIGAGSQSNPFAGYTAQPHYKVFLPQVYPKAAGTFATSLTSTTVAGYVINPGRLLGTWAFVEINGLWTVFKDRREGTGSNAVTEMLGVNDSGLGVGFYKSKGGASVPFEVIISTEQFTNFMPPGAKSAQATGINSLGDVSGWEYTGSANKGFLLRVGTYYWLTHPSAAATEALGINRADQIVGFYRNSSGWRHGFVLTNPTSKSRVWQSIDEPNAKRGTVVTGINDTGDICGFYIDGSGVQHGFVATPS
jgi:hypothetical protein